METTMYDVERIRRQEFSRLKDTVYVDHAGAPQYAESYVRRHCEQLCTNILGNPHSSASTSSERSAGLVDGARHRLLQELGTSSDEYSVVFTAGCTASLNLLSQCFPWSFTDAPQPASSTMTNEDNSSGDRGQCSCDNRSVLAYLADNHTSVVGMRGEAWKQGAHVTCFSTKDIEQSRSVHELLKRGEVIHQQCEMSTPVVTGAEQHPARLSDEGRRVHSSDHGSESGCISSGTDLSSSGCSSCDTIRRQRHCLVAYPLQSNFNGAKYPLSWCRRIQSPPVSATDKNSSLESGIGTCPSIHGHVLLDISGAIGTSLVSLSGEDQPHFVVLSLYKWLGYPSGLGALLVHRDVSNLLRPSFFGGGAVGAYSPHSAFAEPRASVSARLEHGTVSFLSLAALQHGFDTLFSLVDNMAAVEKHTHQLASLAYAQLTSMCHSNGKPVVEVYSSTAYQSSAVQGPVVAFNLLQPDGTYIGNNQVGKLAAAHDIQLRTGCFCNMGACQRWLGLSDERIRHHWASGHQCGDEMDMIDGRPTGAVRISFGYMSNVADVMAVVNFIRSCFLVTEPSSTRALAEASGGEGTAAVESESGKELCLVSLALYPIKSCAAFEVSEWTVGESGFLYDRSWAVVKPGNVVLTQKQCPALGKVQPVVDLARSLLLVHCDGQTTLEVPLHQAVLDDATTKSIRTRVCGNSVCGWHCGEEAAAWFSHVLGQGCFLLQQDMPNNRVLVGASLKSAEEQGNSTVPVSLCNMAPFLCLSLASVNDLHRQMSLSEDMPSLSANQLLERFRGNLVISGSGVPYEEDTWTHGQIGDLNFKSVGPCTRCRMICIDPDTGQRHPEPLRTLARCRGKQMTFGVYMYCTSYQPGSQKATVLRVGDKVSFLAGEHS